jgi:hypothetical protein
MERPTHEFRDGSNEGEMTFTKGAWLRGKKDDEGSACTYIEALKEHGGDGIRLIERERGERRE